MTPVATITKAPGMNQGLKSPTLSSKTAGATLKLTTSISESSCAPNARRSAVRPFRRRAMRPSLQSKTTAQSRPIMAAG